MPRSATNGRLTEAPSEPGRPKWPEGYLEHKMIDRPDIPTNFELLRGDGEGKKEEENRGIFPGYKLSCVGSVT